METSGNLINNSVKQALKAVKRPCITVLRLNMTKYGSWDWYYGCVLLPLGSPTGWSNGLYALTVTCSSCGVRVGVRVRVWYREGVPGGYTGWVIRCPAAKDVPLESGG